MSTTTNELRMTGDDPNRHAALLHQQKELYRSFPDEVNYWTGADTDDHTE